MCIVSLNVHYTKTSALSLYMYMCMYMYMYTYMCLLYNCCDIIHHCRLWSREREEEETKTERRGGSRKQERKEFKTASRVLGV